MWHAHQCTRVHRLAVQMVNNYTYICTSSTPHPYIIFHCLCVYCTYEVRELVPTSPNEGHGLGRNTTNLLQL